MHILVTGATGRVGRNLIPALLEKEHKIIALVIPGDRKRNIIEKMGVEVIEGKLEDNLIFPSLLKGVEAVYHLAGLLPAGHTNDQIFEANIRGTYNILEAIAVNNIKLQRFIFASSDEVYASLKPKYLPLDEYHPCYPYSVYGLSKVIGEKFCNLYYRENGVPVVNARFTYTIESIELLNANSAPGSLFYISGRLNTLKQIQNPLPEILEEIKIFESLYRENGDCLFIAYKKDGSLNEMPICDVRDLVQGLILSLEDDKAVGEAIGFGPPTSFTFDNMVKYLSKKVKIPWVSVRLPIDLPFNFSTNISKAKILLGYKPVWDIYKMIDDAILKKKGGTKS